MTLLAFFVDLMHWSHKTFGPSDLRGPIGPLKHLVKEIDEAAEKPFDVEESADMMHLILDAAWRSKLNWEDIAPDTPQEILRKMNNEVSQVLVQKTLSPQSSYSALFFKRLINMLLVYASYQGVGHDVFMAKIQAKFKKNQERKWGPPSADKPVEHIRSPDEYC